MASNECLNFFAIAYKCVMHARGCLYWRRCPLMNVQQRRYGDFFCLPAVENCAKQHTTAHRNGLHNVPKDRHMTIQYFLAAHDT